MSKRVKLKGENYIDSTGIVHKKELLSDVLNNVLTLFDAVYYKEGDQISIPNDNSRTIVSAYITNTAGTGTGDLRFSIPVKKQLDKINSFDINYIYGQIRYVTGNLSAVDLSTLGDFTRKIISKDTNVLSIELHMRDKVNIQQNTPVSIDIQGLTIVLHE